MAREAGIRLTKSPDWGQAIHMVREDRALLWFLVRSELRTFTQHRLFGMLWWFLDPMALTLTYWLFIGVILGRGGRDFPLFVACAILPWRWFTNGSGMALGSFLGRAGFVKNLRVRRLLVPVSQVLVSTIHFLWAIPVLVIMALAFHKPLTIHLLWLPVIMLVCLMLTTGFGLLLSVLQVYFRDTQNIWVLITRMWFYLSPALYAADRIPDSIRPWFMLNPIAPILVSFRDSLMYGRAPTPYLFVAAGEAVAMLLIGYAVLVRCEKDLVLNI